MQEVIKNTIEIHCAPADLYAYVTQPWRWHEWHPSSLSAKASVPELKVGDNFDETVVLRPLAPLPLKLHRATRYDVLDAEPGKFWRVAGKMKDGWLQIQYEFEAINGASGPAGTRFTRTLTYSATGLSSVLMPLLKGKMRAISVQALANLKQRMEVGASSET